MRPSAAFSDAKRYSPPTSEVLVSEHRTTVVCLQSITLADLESREACAPFNQWLQHSGTRSRHPILPPSHEADTGTTPSVLRVKFKDASVSKQLLQIALVGGSRDGFYTAETLCHAADPACAFCCFLLI